MSLGGPSVPIWDVRFHGDYRGKADNIYSIRALPFVTLGGLQVKAEGRDDRRASLLLSTALRLVVQGVRIIHHKK